MPTDLSKKLVIAISSRALFDLSESNRIYEEQGVEAYTDYQVSHENEILEPSVAFPLVKKLQALKDPDTQEPLVEVILLSRNTADTGLRIFNSIKYYKLNITRAAFSGGENPYQYINAFGADLFLSANPDDVRTALQNHCAAATIYPLMNTMNETDDILRIAFDGDAVLFSDESERIYKEQGLDAFIQHEKETSKTPLNAGPFKRFLFALRKLQQSLKSTNQHTTAGIRIALVTARQAPAHERVINTFRAWNIRIDEMLFLGGVSKGEFLKAFHADFFFDDQKTHCLSASEHVATGHVPHGVGNQ